MLAAAGVRVVGADQSAGMLARARARGMAFSLERTSLQELSYAGQFDAVLTIDAMGHIPPEDWPGVLANLGRAARPGGLVYLTVQELGRHHIERAVTRQWAGSGSRIWRSSMRATGGKTGGAIAISCCAPAQLRQHHDTALHGSLRRCHHARSPAGSPESATVPVDTAQPGGARNRVSPAMTFVAMAGSN
jgi:SAM-dependent methyltransferase